MDLDLLSNTVNLPGPGKHLSGPGGLCVPIVDQLQPCGPGHRSQLAAGLFICKTERMTSVLQDSEGKTEEMYGTCLACILNGLRTIFIFKCWGGSQPAV